jgi:hypothetical protein
MVCMLLVVEKECLKRMYFIVLKKKKKKKLYFTNERYALLPIHSKCYVTQNGFCKKRNIHLDGERQYALMNYKKLCNLINLP